jgi:hypothetical protein
LAAFDKLDLDCPTIQIEIEELGAPIRHCSGQVPSAATKNQENSRGSTLSMKSTNQPIQ